MKTVFTKTKNLKPDKDSSVEKQKNTQNSEVDIIKAAPILIIETKKNNDNKINLSKIFDVIDAGIFVINKEGDLIEVNQAACTIYGYGKTELTGKNIKVFSAENEVIQKLNTVFKDINNCPLILSWQSFHKDGRKINITTSSTTFLHDDGIIYCVITIKNIINSKDKQENTELKTDNYAISDDENISMFEEDAIAIIKTSDNNIIDKTKNLLKLAEKITHIGIIEVDYLSKKRIWSDGYYTLFGLLPNEVEPSVNGYEAYLHPEDKEQFSISILNYIENKISYGQLETRVIKKDGSEITVSVNTYFTFDEAGTPLKFLGIIQDITSIKKATLKIYQSQKLLNNAEKISGFGSFEYNSKTKESIWSEQFYKILGVTPDQFPISETAFVQYIHPDYKETYRRWITNLTDYNQNIEIEIIRPDAEVRNIFIYGKATYNDSGIVEKTVGVIEDITDRKNLEKELQYSKDKYKSLFYDNPSGAFTLDLKGNITSANHIFTLRAECKEEELMKLNYTAFVHPDDLARTSENFENAKKGEFQQAEVKIYTVKGNLLDVMIYCLPIIIDKVITGLFCISIDVTEAKNAQVALNEELFDRESIIAYSTEFICELNLQGQFIKASNASNDFFGFTPDELLNKNITDLRVEKQGVPSFAFFDDIHTKNNIEKIRTNNYRKKNNDTIVLEWKMRWDINKKITYCTVHKINISKLYTQVLDLSEQHNKYLFNSNSQPLFLIDFLYFTITHANDTALNKYKYSLQEFLNLTLNTFFSIKEITLLSELQLDENFYKHFSDQMWIHTKKNGDKVYLNLTGNIVNYKGRRCILTSIDDITEKINADQAIKNSENTRRLIMNASLDAIICIDLNEKITYWNPQAEKTFGWKKENKGGKYLPDIILPKRYRAIHKHIVKSYLKTGESAILNKLLRITAIKQNNEEFPIELTIVPIKEHTEEFFCLYIRDITEQTRAETHKEFERRDKEALINNTNNLIWSVNKENKLIAGNKSFIEAFKFFTGKTIKSGDYVHELNIFFTEENIVWKDLYNKALAGNSFKSEIKIPNKQTDAVTYFEISFLPIYKNKEITGVACYGSDITENKLNHNNLIVINTKLKTAQQIASLGYWEVNLKNNKIFLSDELYNIFGIEKINPEISLEKLFDLIHPDDKKITLKNYFLTIEGKQPFNHEHRIILQDGSIKSVIQKGTLLYDEKGHPIILEGTAQDITYRKNAEKLVKDSEEKYRMIFNSNPSANWIYDLETLKILEVNNSAISHYGYSMKEFLNMSIDDIFILKEIADIIEINKEINSYGIMKFGQWHHIKKSGEIINVDITGHAIFYNNKNAVMIVANDITKILQSQLELAKSIERFEYASKATSDAIWDCDLINNTMFWGEGFNILFGYKLKEREPGISSLGEFSHPDDRQRIIKSLEKVIKSKEEILWHEEYRFKKFNGTYVNVSDRALVVRDTNGDPYRIIGAMQDVTHRLQNEKILKELNGSLNKRAIDLARSNEELEQFAYITSHDLQEPLRMISSFLNQIQKKYDPLLDETGRLYIRFAVDGAVRMRRIILDLLEYSRVGRQLYQYENINTTDLLNEVVSIYTSIIEEKKLVVTFKEIPEIFAARSPIHQLFQNLISNAIKYQHPNSTTKINITCIESNENWLFAVEDNGIGIDPEYFKKIFIIFQRLHNKDEYSGTGIGLAICKKIIDNHNGKIWVESIYGKGSTFYFTIPKLILIQ